MRLLGANPSPPAAIARAESLSASPLLVGAGTRLDPRAVDLFHLHRPRTQKRNNCVAHSLTAPIQVLMWLLAGGAPDPAGTSPTPPPELSVDFGYGGAQLLWQPPPPAGLFPDTGSAVMLFCEWIRDYGLVREDAYREGEGAHGLEVPPDDLWQRAAAATCTGFHKLDEGAAAPEQVCAALVLAEEARCAAPNIVITADDAFGAVPDGGVYAGPGGAILGGHSLAILAFDPARGPNGEFGIGDTWGRRRVWFPWDFVANHGREMVVVLAAPVSSAVG